MLFSVKTVPQKGSVLFSHINKYIYTNLSAGKSDYAGPSTPYITVVLIACSVYAVTCYTHSYP